VSLQLQDQCLQEFVVLGGSPDGDTNAIIAVDFVSLDQKWREAQVCSSKADLCLHESDSRLRACRQRSCRFWMGVSTDVRSVSPSGGHEGARLSVWDTEEDKVGVRWVNVLGQE
jgi:hypothetical protein